MAIEIKMPAPTPGMTEGALIRWLKHEGDSVESGDVIVEVETNKATLEVEVFDEGILSKILVPAGSEQVPVGTVIAILTEHGEELAAEPATEISAPEETLVTAAGFGNSVPRPHEDRVFASPLARRLACQYDLDIASLPGSGPRGRVVRVDVESARDSRALAKVEEPVDSGVFSQQNDQQVEYISNNSMRRTIAARLSESKREIPHFYLTLDCDVSGLLILRAQLNVKGAKASPTYKLSVNDIVVCAVARALRTVPEVNASWTDAAIKRYLSVDVSVAVATEGGLITPVIREADRKGLAEIASEVRELAEKARTGSLKPAEYQGGGFTISNLGMYGIREFSAIINPPQAAILAVGSIEKRPVVRDNELAVGELMTLTLSVDHRVVDGAVAARFLAVLRGLLEDPVTMLV
ncbi:MULTISPECIES: dihydrolipoamide acetyltransferase family protein [unclassified Marinobacter]|jgi:pyruvate dehydrogenase E2 component (dihydrolipoamide acetyltransferase)|uniref:dihydrolipoamide acetyltransferase family protein n=1 Tax=unclassified Marinobacter TaxID=83889 RepID=UPI002010BF3A|nr:MULTISPECIES: dihydrolipoamide acetyltransferase family protein [unclassified Marinobacter]MCL1476231.1 2-oxo acid dehydrogenase subunit E2 [Marinobacter sp.]MCL1482986.1 2-oxo acid dehydrogenase subunit E2 [Marinobacter sp.]MCL1488800.1 2-oxo acid dehydrogenase subunit E2 [Marinobacter sp.]UQG58117.1 2-oxo acid dehydrogenase subunit E2 [Marinobacter sp. M4C]UQG66922.1 2-oxo acid dehydrogenase subunit E2 [Marinobacter sp. M2C]